MLGIIWSIVSPKLQIYAVTNKRALIYVKRFRVLIVSINLGSVSNIRRTGRENIGTIHFVESNLLNRWNGWFAQEQPTAFFGIKNPKNLEALILEHFKSQDTTR